MLTGRLSLLADRFGWSMDCQEAVAQELSSTAMVPGGRYLDLGPLGVGGMGEVRRVHDRRLGRSAALKALRVELSAHAAARARFIAEAEITAQLTHPGVIPVYDIGELDDGRPYYTMKEVAGRTFTALIDPTQGEPGLRRAVGLYVRVVETIAYAHDRGITHRDLKPDNVMVGAFGEVLVLDWGLARVGKDTDQGEAIQLTAEASRLATRMGTVSGTPAYMAPEQAAGRVHEVGPAADAWALGAILYEILTGNAPYTGTAADILAAVVAGPPSPPTGPAELVDLVMQALTTDHTARPPASLLAARAQDWLDGASRRVRALELVAEADRLAARAVEREGAASSGQQVAAQRLGSVPAHAGPEAKRTAWEEAAAAEALHDEAELDKVRVVETLHAALSHSPGLPEAHDRLADIYKGALTEAEAIGDDAAAARAELRVRTHDRGRYVGWLEGKGRLTLQTDPPDAAATLYRYVEREHRLQPELVADLGAAPIAARTLDRGSYLVVLRAPGRAEVRYPVSIGRNEEWSSVPPGATSPQPIWLPPAEALADDEVYVPGGWTWCGSRSPVDEELPVRRVWIDSLCMQRLPVTNADFIRFLDALVEEGREDDALLCCPRTPDAGSRPGTLLYGRTEEGRFCLRPDADGDLWQLDWPVFFVNHPAMVAYAAWLGAHTGRNLRLPHELEWEKAARGVDLRRYPWGDRFDPSFCHSRESRPGRPTPAPVGSYPIDESPYGVGDMAGNATDLCRNRYRLTGPPFDPDGRWVEEDAASDEYHVARGGAWDYLGRACQISQRFLRLGTGRRAQGSFRLARDFSPIAR